MNTSVSSLVLSLLLGALALPWASPAQAQDAPTPGRKPVVGEFYVQPPDTLAPRMVQSLKEHIDHLLRKVYVKPEDLYRPPLEGTEGFTYDQVTPQEAVPVLAGNVAAMTGEIEGLAVGQANGDIFVWSGFACRQMAMPGGRQPAILAWGHGSPLLAAVDATRRTIQVFDLRTCGPPRAPALPAGIQIIQAAMSDQGFWLAFIDADGGLWAGPPLGPFTRVEGLPGAPIMVGFTALQGLLVAADASGQTLGFALMNRQVLRRMEVPGGPFTQGFVSGQAVNLVTGSGSTVAWNLLQPGPVQATQQEQGRIFIRDGKVFYTTGLTRWLKTTRMRRPEFLLSHSASLGLLRLRDLDGETRYFSVHTGEPAQAPVQDSPDWALATGKAGVFQVNGQEFKVYDPVCQVGYLRLLCRYIPKKGFFIWWQGMESQNSFNIRPMHLPVRTSLKADSEPAWKDLYSGDLP